VQVVVVKSEGVRLSQQATTPMAAAAKPKVLLPPQLALLPVAVVVGVGTTRAIHRPRTRRREGSRTEKDRQTAAVVKEAVAMVAAMAVAMVAAMAAAVGSMCSLTRRAAQGWWWRI
jgi:hypothetical protein